MGDPRFQRLRAERWDMRKPAAVGRHGIVTSHHGAAAEAGAAVLEAGGNAVDAAVTAAFVLQVVEPWMSGLAGCGYLVVAEPSGPVSVVEFTGRAPKSLDPEAYAPDPDGAVSHLGYPAAKGLANILGFRSALVPGTVRGLAEALKRFGTLPFEPTLRPALEHARRGLTVDWHTTLAIALAEAELRADPGARAMWMPDGMVPEPGTVLRLDALARTFERLAEAGPEDFYEGEIAGRFLSDLQAGGSFITAEDLSAYRPSVYTAPSVAAAGRRIHLAGESSGSPRFLDALRHFEAHRGTGPVDPDYFVAIARSMQHAFVEHRRRNAPNDRARLGSTTHLNAVDRDGRMVALTFTLLSRFGARAVAPSTGIPLNNGMAWFDTRPGRLNSLEPGATAPNNMCPIAVTDDRGPLAVMGASGGVQIVPALLQICTMLLHAGLDVEDALNRPRISAGPTEETVVDLDLDRETVAALERLGPIAPAERGVYPRPFASPAAIARRGDGFAGMPDTTYPPAEAVAARTAG